jgi:hypothetical protein
MWHHFLFYIQGLLINTTGEASSSPAPRLHPPKSTEESLTLASESVGANQKEEPEIVVAPLVLLKNQEQQQKNHLQQPLLKFHKKFNLSLKHLQKRMLTPLSLWNPD